MSNAYTYRMPQGIPGALTRQSQAQVEAGIFGATAFGLYGMPCKMVSGLIIPLAVVGDTQPFGFLVRPYPTGGPNASDPLGTAVPPTSGICNVMRKGYISVFVQNNASSVAAGGTVYARYLLSGSLIVGGIEATSIASNTVALTGCYFTGAADAAGNAEVYFDCAGQVGN
jgi:hypothetical protein